MDSKEILDVTGHRPYPVPTGFWVMKQVWKDLLFAHWPVSPDALKAQIPSGLDLDTKDGAAWITISPFMIDPIQMRGLPPVPGIRRMLELNVRTYVIRDGRPGVFFLTLEASHPLAVVAARYIGHLPYHYAEMSRSWSNKQITYLSRRRIVRGEEAVFRGKYGPISNRVFHAEKETLLYWLTERYCLYTVDTKGRLYYGDIHHQPWPLQEAELQLEDNTLLTVYNPGIDGMKPPALLTYTKQLEVLIWPIKKIN